MIAAYGDRLREPGRFPRGVREQASQLRIQLTAGERNTRMFKRTDEQTKTNYMTQLDDWIDEQVIEPLFEAWDYQDKAASEEDAKAASEEVEETRSAVHKAIKEKTLESYRNGQKSSGQRRGFGRERQK